MSIRFNTKYLNGFLSEDDFHAVAAEAAAAHRKLREKTGAGSDFLGWVDLPVNYDRDEFARIQKAAQKIRRDSAALVVIGIGGSYLGARAAIEYCTSQNYNLVCRDTPQIFFTGNSISSAALQEIVSLVSDRDFSVNVISKSGTTTEPAVAFRVFRELLETKYGTNRLLNRS